MKSAMRLVLVLPALCGVALLAANEKTASEAEQTVTDTYCPLWFYGQWDGIYYYYAQLCDGACSTYNGVSSNTPLTIDHECVGCNGSPGCSDPVTTSRVKRGKGDKKTAAHGFQVVYPPGFKPPTDYIPPRTAGGPPGSSPAPNGRFYAAGIHVQHLPSSDEVAVVKHPKHGEREFRVLSLRLSSGAHTAQLHIARELDPGKKAKATARKSATVLGTPADQKLRLQIDDADFPGDRRVIHALASRPW